MEELLTECCILVTELLQKLRDEGKITEKEYQNEVRLKMDFLTQNGK